MARQSLSMNFDQTLAKAAYESLHVFGSAGRDAILKYLETRGFLQVDEIAERPQDFDACLRELFGRCSAVVEALIVRRMSVLLGLRCPQTSETEFATLIEETKKNILTGT